ncbi:MAG: DUF3352 domain-containing protein [Bacteroidota bacterium]
MKRNLIIFLIIILAVVAGFIYFTKDDVVFSKEASLYKIVPVSSPAFIEFSSLNAIPSKNQILAELSKIDDFDRIMTSIEKVDSLIKNNNEINKGLARRPVIVAVDFIGENVLRPLIISKISNTSELKSFDKLVENLFETQKVSFQTRKYSGHKITDVVKENGKPALHYCFTGGLIIISPESILVEKSIRQQNTQNLTDNTFFTKVNKTAISQSDISFYINHEHFPGLLANFINGKTKTVLNEFGEALNLNYKKSANELQNYASWSELDLGVHDNSITLNGISTADDSLTHFLSVFEQQQPVPFHADKVLPKNTSFFINWSFSDKELFFHNLENYFTHSNSYYKREEQIKKIEKRFRVNLKNTLKGIVRNQVTAAITTVSGQPGEKTTLFIVNSNNRAEAQSVFETLISNYARSKGIQINSLKTNYTVDDKNNFNIYRFPYPSLPGIWLGESFGFTNAAYAAFWEDNLVFCSSEKALQKYLHQMVSHSTLSKSVGYSAYKKAVESKTNTNTYVNVNRLYALNKELFNQDMISGFDRNEEIFRKFGAIGWQVVCERDIFFNNINLTFNDKPQIEPNTIWQYSTGTTVSQKPKIVINHRDKSKKEIIVQNDGNTLHLVNSNGGKIWSIPVDGRILGSIHQIDYYRNGKLQFLFNTKDKLYLIDKNGNNVANFPVKFKSPATNGVNVFDYDNNRKYRYFVACENRKVYAYDHDARMITGWKFGQTGSNVTTPVQHFRVNNKDYIVFKDNSKIYIQNRRGETRVKTSAGFENSKNPLMLNLNGTPKIVATDKTGKVYYIYFNGKYTEKKTGKFSAEHFFTIKDINGNSIPDFVFVDGRELKVMDENGKKIFSKKFDTNIRNRPNLYSFASSQKKIGIVEADENRIYLFDINGKLQEGFPLSGNSEFSIGKLSGEKLNLVVGSLGGDVYNYILE